MKENKVQIILTAVAAIAVVSILLYTNFLNRTPPAPDQALQPVVQPAIATTTNETIPEITPEPTPKLESFSTFDEFKAYAQTFPEDLNSRFPDAPRLFIDRWDRELVDLNYFYTEHIQTLVNETYVGEFRVSFYQEEMRQDGSPFFNVEARFTGTLFMEDPKCRGL